MSPKQKSIVEQVCLELSEMRKLDMKVPDGAEDYVRAHPAEIEEYRASMRVCDIADLVISLVR